MADVAQTDIEQIPAEVETPILSVTPAALDKIRELLTSRNLTDHALRVFVQGGGCSGLSYGMAFENQFYPQDSIVETGGVRLVVDNMSLGYLQGAEIDYVDNLMGGGFAINNPNAVSSCGCGHSFRTAGSEAGDAAGGACGCGGH